MPDYMRHSNGQVNTNNTELTTSDDTITDQEQQVREKKERTIIKN